MMKKAEIEEEDLEAVIVALQQRVVDDKARIEVLTADLDKERAARKREREIRLRLERESSEIAKSKRAVRLARVRKLETREQDHGSGNAKTFAVNPSSVFEAERRLQDAERVRDEAARSLEEELDAYEGRR